MTLWIAIVLGTLAAPAGLQASAATSTLFERLVGRWVLQGTIDGRQTTHDVDADLVLNKGYVRLHEVSREKDDKGAPQYEALVFISVDAKSGEYACLWLDTTSSSGLSNGGIARGKPEGNTIPFLFTLANGEVFHNTFIYTPDSDSWRWELDGETNGKREPFARVTLTRR